MPDEYDPSPKKLTLLEKDIAKPETAQLDDDLY